MRIMRRVVLHMVGPGELAPHPPEKHPPTPLHRRGRFPVAAARVAVAARVGADRVPEAISGPLQAAYGHGQWPSHHVGVGSGGRDPRQSGRTASRTPTHPHPPARRSESHARTTCCSPHSHTTFSPTPPPLKSTDIDPPTPSFLGHHPLSRDPEKVQKRHHVSENTGVRPRIRADRVANRIFLYRKLYLCPSGTEGPALQLEVVCLWSSSDPSRKAPCRR